MAKISKRKLAEHERACDLVHSDRPLSYDERLFVVQNWDPQACHNITKGSAFFTPLEIAGDMMIEACDPNRLPVLDLAAGIGILGFALENRIGRKFDLKCVEINPDFVAVGKRVLPYADWVCEDAVEWSKGSSERFCQTISNPPYGHRKGVGALEYIFAEIAMKNSDYGVFLMPAGRLTDWKFSGEDTFTNLKNDRYEKWSKKTGIVLECNCGIDCSIYKNLWNGTVITVDVVLVSKGETGAPITE